MATFCQTVAEAAQMLKSGQLVAFPTETVYGLGADAGNPDSVAGIFESKQRPSFDPLIVHVSCAESAADLVTTFPDSARILADTFWPGPLTIVLPKRPRIPDLVTAGLPGVGLRMPNHPLALELLTAAECPVAAPSANPFGGISPTTAQHVADALGDRIDGILDGGPCQVGIESTVVSLMSDQPTILRPGGLAVEDIESAIGPVLHATPSPKEEDAAQLAPGMLSRHYAPATPLRVVDRDSSVNPIAGKRCGLLTYGKSSGNSDFTIIEQLGDSQDLRTCTANFFAALHRLDSAGLDVIIACRFPSHGLGIALNDRLLRAAKT